MAQPIDHLKDRLVEQVAALISERLEPAEHPLAERLLRSSYANVAPEDVLAREPDALYGAVLSMLALARQRLPGQAKLRVFQPRADEGGWDSEHTVIEVVNDDMPFLVDSLTAAVQRSELAVHLVLHPVLPMVRDEAGRLQDIPGDAGAGAPFESLMHIEIDRLTDPARLLALSDRLAAVLADVRAAVEDWRAMRERVAAILAELAAPAESGRAREIAEVRDFLDWIHHDNFTFLGYRDLRFDLDAAADGAIAVEPGSGLGILRDPDFRIFDTERDLATMTAEVVAFLRRPAVLLLTKADRVAAVHRPVPMDIVGIKRFDVEGRVVGLHVLVGLFTHSAYALSPLQIPLLRGKVGRIAERAGFRPNSHDGKALQAILETYPRDELLQAGEADLYDTAIAILRLQERQRVAVFLRRDEFERFVSILVFIPRDRYDTRLRLKIQQLFEDGCAGRVTAWYTQVAEAPLARLQFFVKTMPGQAPLIDRAALESRLADITRSWTDRLQEALIESHGEERGLALHRRWAASFPLAYREDVAPRAACLDIARIEAARDGFALHLYRPVEAADSALRFKIYRQGQPVALSDVLPLFEHMGFRVISEQPYELRRPAEEPLWIHDFTMVSQDGRAVEIERLRGGFEDAFRAVWLGAAEDDGFNRLVVNAGLTWRQVMVLRAYAKYLRQAGSTFSQSYVERSVTGNPAVAALLVALFEARFDPDGPCGDGDVPARIQSALEAVASADEDRILRRFLNLIEATLRTNFFQTASDGTPKSYLSFKLDSHRVEGLPLPRPMAEIFVYAPFTEGIHLRAGKVARGGIRWSDRPEDFRTETLGLMKAQTMKNSVIVPVGAKGGFVVKRPPRTGGREAFQEEGIRCYRTLMRGLLDLTDNLAGGQVVVPSRVVRRDGDDPYLVVAADKGTATFSDIANEISAEYGFWLGDAFASGGSQGYDHKGMAITARGAWESVKRHFREMGRDIQKNDMTVVGVGDMSGDVFGNGMLRSPHLKLVAAFDHRHIFLDPDPDPELSFAERRRLFDLPRSSWSDYDRGRLSAGGGVFARDAKSIALSPEVRKLFDIEMESLPPSDLITRLLAAPVDLLWFGGIGTYVKAGFETHAAVGDRANDALRIDARMLRCKVIGEGGNLAMTQHGRVEAALAGIRLNTDAIDNSAGVDCSDHEVNIKILLDGAVRDGDLTVKQRNELLSSMTDEVGHLVLRDNYLQTQALSIFQVQAPQMLDQQDRFMRLLERQGRLDRRIEFLPDDDEIARRALDEKGLTRPEISILLAYGKLWLYDAILDSDLPDDPLLLDELVRYFPTLVRGESWRARMDGHRLRREIVATVSANSMVNRVGGSFIARLMERTGTPPADLARAYLIVRDGFSLRDVWEGIEGLDTLVPAEIQTAMFIEINRLIERGVGWVLGHAPRPLDIGRSRAELEPGIVALRDCLERILPADTLAALTVRAAEYQASGVPEDLARRVASLIVLASANDIGRIAARVGRPVETVGRLYFLMTARFGMGWLRAAAERLQASSHWEKMAGEAVIDDLYVRQAELTASVAAMAGDLDAEAALAAWAESRRAAVERADQLLVELKGATRLDLSTLVVASHQFQALIEG
ncbi:NAD-glutamate dehydrogenase [Telmatospirillum siberiense]|uniref:NAD-glutamate dehydrogenase n=1 Tax=Telmatospirillum siberiense TaxID=382514 RepID=A0A2N3PT13_9PROT|nr:NAD-glutamate dehydrogenase [Telmatospirillum siberiense]PKU23543.1 NAD-glutamate dehydrogenase [Telmatospirillum siberiense]